MREADSKRLVIDTDVAQASGSEEAIHPRAKHCRDFLQEVLSLSHSVVMTPEISNEWKRHRSSFARRWRVSMDARKKVYRVNAPADEELYDKIKQTGTNLEESEDMQKDFHLLETARATDQTVVSLDETVRGLFARAAQRVGEIRDIVWVNPERTEEEKPLVWLQNGAPPEDHRKLRAWRIV
ncbi:hypothetical protein J4G02_09830 [Candidatus Poribacteria bacterium]|nr:hypothetical protein [Candidatus Poribacteria bacterium]